MFKDIAWNSDLVCSIVTFEHSEMADELKQKRGISLGQFTRAEKRLESSLKSEVTVTTIERRFEELKEKWHTVQERHDEYVAELLVVNSQTDVKAEEQWLNGVTERFDAIEVEADRTLEKIKAVALKQVPTAVMKTEVLDHSQISPQYMGETELLPGSSIQLERIKLDPFKGDIRKYPKFKEQFEKYVKPLCRPSQLPFVLKSYLDDEVKEEVDNSDDDIATLWKRLDTKYGNSGRLVDTILADISKIPRGDGKNTLLMIKTVEKAYRDLSRMDRCGEMENGTILSLIEKKLPDEIRCEWIKIVASQEEDDDPSQKFKLLLELLQNWKVRLEYDQALIRKVTEKKSVSNHATAHTDRSKKIQKERCWIHSNENHPIWVCNVFKKKDFSEKLKLVKENKACCACLEVRCPGANDASSCKRNFICNVSGCNEPHNSLLHPPASPL